MKRKERAEEVLCLDFDGTCIESAPGADEELVAAYQAGLAKLLERPIDWVERAYEEVRQLIHARPDEFGWEINGFIVAPATIDSFVEAHVCAQLILKAMGADIERWAERLHALYQQCYSMHRTVFRPEFLGVCRSFREREIPFYIVTNADPEKVRYRLREFGADADWIRNRVYGSAKKYVVTPGPGCVAQHMSFPGLRRPVALRKQHYYAVLRILREIHGVEWRQFVVVGDIAELDLVMPVALGARGYLILRPGTPAYEQRWAEEHPRVEVITDLTGVIM